MAPRKMKILNRNRIMLIIAVLIIAALAVTTWFNEQNQPHKLIDVTDFRKGKFEADY